MIYLGNFNIMELQAKVMRSVKVQDNFLSLCHSLWFGDCNQLKTPCFTPPRLNVSNQVPPNWEAIGGVTTLGAGQTQLRDIKVLNFLGRELFNGTA